MARTSRKNCESLSLLFIDFLLKCAWCLSLDFSNINKSILILCDSGGGNSYRNHVFKKHMLLFAEKIGIDIIICHYPPYTSKWNPIEHRLFCHVHHAIQGAVFSDYDFVKELFAKTKTDTGLKVTVRLNLKEYKTGIITDKKEVDFDRIKFNQFVPHLSYHIAA